MKLAFKCGLVGLRFGLDTGKESRVEFSDTEVFLALRMGFRNLGHTRLLYDCRSDVISTHEDKDGCIVSLCSSSQPGS
jgi:hypothetical protein